MSSVHVNRVSTLVSCAYPFEAGAIYQMEIEILCSAYAFTFVLDIWLHTTIGSSEIGRIYVWCTYGITTTNMWGNPCRGSNSCASQDTSYYYNCLAGLDRQNNELGVPAFECELRDRLDLMQCMTKMTFAYRLKHNMLIIGEDLCDKTIPTIRALQLPSCQICGGMTVLAIAPLRKEIGG